MKQQEKADATIVIRRGIRAEMRSVRQGNRNLIIIEVNDPDSVKVIPLGPGNGRVMVDVRKGVD